MKQAARFSERPEGEHLPKHLKIEMTLLAKSVRPEVY